MSSTSSPSLRLDVRARRSERWLALALIALAAIIPSFFGVASGVALAASLVAAVVALYAMRREGWLNARDPIDTITWRSAGEWELGARGGTQWVCELGRASRATSGAVWLCLRESDGRRTWRFLLTPSDLSADDFRRLYVRLRLDGARVRDVAAAITGQRRSGARS
jgi:hypothetical protein